MIKSAIVLAAGHGTRMKSQTHKVLHPVCGKPMIHHILDMLEELGVDQIVVVVGQQREKVVEAVGARADIAIQEEQNGTGDAVKAALPKLRKDAQMVVVLYGDAPLVQANTIRQLFETKERDKAQAVILTADVENPTGLGRVFFDGLGQVDRIVEEKDATPEERQNHIINSGIYAYDVAALEASLAELKANNAQGEYYLTDTLGIIAKRGGKVVPLQVERADEIASVNDRYQLAQVEALARRIILEKWMREGVTVVDPANTYIEASVRLASDVTLLPGTILTGDTTVESFATVGPNCRLVDTVVHQGATIQYTVASDAEIGAEAQVGPFAYLRPGTRVGDRCKVGDFVELKNSTLGDDTKVSHLAYVGDAKIGRGVNIGCGVITVNYDGEKKHRTTVGDGSFVGSNVNLIAPVQIGSGAYICAGSTVTDDVGDDAFVIARTPQTTKPNYVRAWKAKKAQNSKTKGGDTSGH